MVSINFGQIPGSCSYKLFNSCKQVFLKGELNLWIIFVKELNLSWNSVTSPIANSFICTLTFPANKSLFVVNDKNRNTKESCEMCLKLFTLPSNVFVADLEQAVEVLTILNLSTTHTIIALLVIVFFICYAFWPEKKSRNIKGI